MKQDGRGKHGRQGRKATGRKRTVPLSAKFTTEERDSIVEAAKLAGMNQADFVLSCIGGFIDKFKRKGL